MKASSRRPVALVALVVTAVVIRIVACWAFPTSLDDDPDAYAAIAITLSQTGTFGLTNPNGQTHPTAFRPPLYPWLLSFLVENDHLNRIAVICLHAGLGGITVLLTALTSRRLLGDQGLIAGALVAIDPILLQQSTLVMTETLAATLATALVWWWATRCQSPNSLRFAVILGTLASLAFLCRPTFIVWGGLLVVACTSLRGTVRERLVRSAILAMLLALTVGAWTIRNQQQFGRAIWATTHGGYTLLLANNPMFYDYLRTRSPGEVWNAESFFVAWDHRQQGDVNNAEFWLQDWNNTPVNLDGANELVDDDRASGAAKATIRREPSMFVWSCVVRFSRLWSPLPHRTPGRSAKSVIAIGVLYGTIYVLGGIGLWRLGRRVTTSPWWSIWMLALTLSAVHTIYWSNLRMRSPVTCGIAILAAAAFKARGDRTETQDSHRALPSVGLESMR